MATKKQTAKKKAAKKVAAKKKAAPKKASTRTAAGKKKATAKAAVKAAPTPTPTEVVTRFLEHLEALDTEAALGLVGERCLYENVPFHQADGKAAIRRDLGSFDKLMTGFEVHMRYIVAEGSVVMTERTDVLKAGPVELSILIMGVFEVRDGKIVAWRDYFDWLSMSRDLAASAMRAPLDFARMLPDLLPGR